MPLIHERAFRVRHYECDAYGHVNHANYLRYMQEAALDASAAAGYDIDWYERHQRQWLIRETAITYLKPLTYGDSVIVKTWVQDFHRVRSRRAYELRHAEGGAVVARAFTDWVYMDTAALRPVSVPDEMIGAFFPEGLPAARSRREPFAAPPDPPPGVFTMIRRVEWHDLDTAQHVNNANYMGYLEECSVRVAAAFGWPMARMKAEGFGVVAREYHIEHKQPAVLDDELTIATWVSDVRRSTAVRHYTITRAADGTLIVRANMQWVWVDLATGRPVRIPDAFAADFAPNIVSEAGPR